MCLQFECISTTELTVDSRSSHCYSPIRCYKTCDVRLSAHCIHAESKIASFVYLSELSYMVLTVIYIYIYIFIYIYIYIYIDIQKHISQYLGKTPLFKQVWLKSMSHFIWTHFFDSFSISRKTFLYSYKFLIKGIVLNTIFL